MASYPQMYSFLSFDLARVPQAVSIVEYLNLLSINHAATGAEPWL
jgi:hypothetical protein